MIGDVQQILNAPSGEKNGSKFLGLSNLSSKKSTPKTGTPVPRKPEGMTRELYNLISAKDMSTMMPTDMRKTYKNPKFQMGFRNVRKYKWVPFTNEARTDGLQLFHWQRIDKIDSNRPYPFARFNKVIEIPSFTDEEYENHLKSNKWTREETDYLFEVCRRFDIRWPIVHDRYDQKKFQITRTMEDMKDRFYSILYELSLLRDPNSSFTAYDSEHEKRRKEQLVKQWDRSKEQIEEEENLIAELRRIEQRRKEREKKAHDLQKLINMSEQPASPCTSSSMANPNLGKRNKAFRNKTCSISTSNVAAFNPLDISVNALRFSEFKSSGAHFRTQEMKLPTNIGQKKLKNIENVLKGLEMEVNPVGSEVIMRIYNDFRSQIVLLQELKSALQTSEFELESLRNKMQEYGKDFEIEPKLRISNLMRGGHDDLSIGGEGNPMTNRKITSFIDVNQKDLMSLTSRKRKVPGVVTPNTSMELKRSRKI